MQLIQISIFKVTVIRRNIASTETEKPYYQYDKPDDSPTPAPVFSHMVIMYNKWCVMCVMSKITLMLHVVPLSCMYDKSLYHII